LLGQNVNAYHGKGGDQTSWGTGAAFAEGIIRQSQVGRLALHHKPSEGWIDRLIAAHRDIPSVCRILHLPIQSALTAFWQRLNRRAFTTARTICGAD